VGLLAVLLLPAVLAYVCYAAALAALARRSGSARAAWAWIPGPNLLLPFALAGRSLAWGALLLVPPVNLIVWVLVWAEVLSRRGRPAWTAVGMAVPGVNLLLLAHLAGVSPARMTAAAAVLVASFAAAGVARARATRARVAQEIGRLRDPRVEQRRAAAAALAGGPAADASVAPLMNALGDADADVRRDAARGLARLGRRATAAGAELQRLLQRESEPAVRAEAARALVAIGGSDAAPSPVEPLIAGLLDAARGTADREMPDTPLVDALAREGRAAVPQLVTALRDPDAGVRWHAAAALMHVGRRAAGSTPDVRRAMDDSVWTVRNAAGRALEEVVGPEDVPALVQAIGDPSVETRYHAARALARLGEDAAPAVSALAAALRDDDWEVRTESLRALSNAGSAASAALPGIVGVLGQDADPQVRAAAAWALGALGPAPGAADALRRALSDPAAEVRRAAGAVLARFERAGG
jgi:HEAT repeat protein